MKRATDRNARARGRVQRNGELPGSFTDRAAAPTAVLESALLRASAPTPTPVLKPPVVSKELDPEGIPQFGLVAEEVARVNPDLVVTDEQRQPFSVRYEEINAMLLNEFLKEHRKVEEQGAKIMQQRKDFETAIARQQKQVEALTAGLQRVRAQVEMSRPAPQTVLNAPNSKIDATMTIAGCDY